MTMDALCSVFRFGIQEEIDQNQTATHEDPWLQSWLVVSTPLKNMSQLGLLFPMYGKIKLVPNHQPESE